jgi:hypothetical protein
MEQNSGGSLAERLRARKGTGGNIGQTIAGAIEGLKEASVILDAVYKGTALGIAHEKIILGKGSGEATGRWLSMDWQEFEREIQFLASLEGGVSEDAKEVLTTIALTRENPIFYQAIGTVFQQVLRPARLIWNEQDLDGFLFHMVKQGLLVETDEAPGWTKSFEWKGKWYSAASRLLQARLAWPHILGAYRRVQRREKVEEQVGPRLKPLLEMTTLLNDLEEKNLSRLIKGDVLGSMVIWTLHSGVSKAQEDMGFLALLLARFEVGSQSLILTNFEADQALPMGKDQDFELPALIWNEAPGSGLLEVGFGQLSGFSKEEHLALLRIQRLIRWWVGKEGALPRVRELPSPAVPTAEQETR